MKSNTKLISLLLVVILLLSVTVITAQAETTKTTDTTFKVTAVSNTGAITTQTYDTARTKYVVMNLSIATTKLLASGQGYISFDDEYLETKDVVLNDKIKNPTIYTRINNKITFNFQTVDDLYEFSETETFASIKFVVLKPGETTININYQEFTSLENDVPVDIVADDKVVEGEEFKDSVELFGKSFVVNTITKNNDNTTTLNSSKNYDVTYNRIITVDFSFCFNEGYVTTIEGFTSFDPEFLELTAVRMKSPNNDSNFIGYVASNDGISFYLLNDELSSGQVFMSLKFKALKDTGETDIVTKYDNLDGEELSDVSEQTSPNNERTIDDPPESETFPTQPGQPYTPPIIYGPTTLKLTAPKKSMYVGTTMALNAKITNQVGNITYEVSNSKVGVVDENGVVTAKHKGNLTVKAKNNGKVASVKIKVLQRNNPVKVKIEQKRFTAKSTKKTTIKKAKIFKVTKAKGKVVFYRANKDKKFAVKTNGNVVVAKGLKKGKTYTVKVKVVAKGNNVYKKKIIIKNIKIKVV